MSKNPGQRQCNPGPIALFFLYAAFLPCAQAQTASDSGVSSSPDDVPALDSADASADAFDPLAIDPSQPLDPIDGIAVDWPDDKDIPPWPDDSPASARGVQDDAQADTISSQVGAAGDNAASLASEAEMSAEALIEAEDAAPPAQAGSDTGNRRAGLRGLAGADLNYTITLDYLDGQPLETVSAGAFRERFNALSTLVRLDGDAANLAQVNRRARADRDLLDRLLRVYGYYDGNVDQQVERAEGKDAVALTFAMTPGPLYHLSSVDLPGLQDTGADAVPLRARVGLKPGDPLLGDAIESGTEQLRSGLLESGFAFSSVEDPLLTVDHAARMGALEIAVSAGGRYRFGAIRINEGAPFGARHLQRIARFQSGELYQASKVEDLRRAILATGLVSTVSLTPVPVEPPGQAAVGDAGTVDLAIETAPAPLRTVAGEIGYGTGEGYRIAASWEHRNFFPPEGLVRARGVIGTQEQLASLTYRRNNFRARDQVLTAQASVGNIQRDAYDARTILFSGVIERQTNLIFQKKWTWSLGGELTLTDERDSRTRIVGGSRQTFFIAAAPTALSYDGTDDLLDPKQGFRLGGRVSPELSLQSGVDGYVRVQLDGSYYQPVSDNVVLAGRVRLASIAGISRFSLAPSRRLYAGGGGSVRGYGYQQIGQRDANNDPIGGRGLAEFSLEARVRFGDFGVVPFIDAGNVYAASLPDFTGLRFGAGLGLRYYSNFGPLRIDVGTPINREAGDSRIAVAISLGQAF